MSTLRRILGYALARRGLAGAALGAHVVQILLSLALPLFLKSAIDNGLTNRDYRLIVLAAVGTLAVTAVRGVIW